VRGMRFAANARMQMKGPWVRPSRDGKVISKGMIRDMVRKSVSSGLLRENSRTVAFCRAVRFGGTSEAA
jgi:hypothetical protein